MFRSTNWVVCGAALLLGSAAVTAHAQEANADDEEARVHFRLGNAYFESGRFVEAAREFEQAYELSGRPELLFNIFVSHRDAGNVEPAAEALRRYLERVPDAPDRQQLTARLAAMDRTLAARAERGEPREEPRHEAEPTDGEPTDAEPTDGERRRAPPPVQAESGGSDLWVPGFVIGGVGALAAIAGIFTGVAALDSEQSLTEDCGPSGGCPPDFEGTRDSGQALALATDVLLFGGLAIAAAGVILAFVLGESGADDVQAGLGCGPAGCVGEVRWSY